MYKIKLVFLVFFSMTLLPVLLAQNNTNSPYTRYGYGNIADQAFTSQRGMGGIGYGLRNSQTINPLNPASFSSVDSMTFMLDMGVMGQLSWFEDGMNKEKKTNGNVEYIAMQFPLSKNLGMGVGFEPFSYVGYNYGDTAYLPFTGETSQQTYRGRGGLSQLYGSVSYNFFNRLALGVSVGYLFGDIIHERVVSFSNTGNYNTQWTDTLRSRGLTYDIGVQYTHPVGKNQNLVFGAVYTPKTKFNGKVMNSIIRYEPSSNAIMGDPIYSTSRDSVFQLPESYAFGVTYNKKNKYTVGADFLYQKWEDAKFYDQTKALSNRMKINAGGEYIPDYTSNNFFSKMHYRAGAYYTNSYVELKGEGYKEYGATLGLGIPMNDRRSFLNFAFEYSMIRPESSSLIDEQYLKLTVSYTFNELWFFKRKVQ